MKIAGFILSALVFILMFSVGFLDRIIHVPMFWKQSPSLLDRRYYGTDVFFKSLIRVVVVLALVAAFIIYKIYLHGKV